ncbi:MAG: hypothetical protein ABJO86_08950 [Lentilitoribacter sp.]
MISAFAGYQQSANISLLQSSQENGAPQKGTQPAGPRNVLNAIQSHQDGARQSFDKASSQIITAFMDSLQNRISDEPVKGGNNAGTLTSLTTAEFESTLSVSAMKSDGNGNAMSLDLESFAGLSFSMEQENGKLTGFSLDFEMSTSMAFEGSNAGGGYQAVSYENLQSFSIDFSIGEDENGNTVTSFSIERSEVTQASFISFGDQEGLGFGAGVGSLNDMAALFDEGGTQSNFDQDEGESPLTADALVDLEMEAALEIMKSIAEAARDNTVNSLFGETYYEDY